MINFRNILDGIDIQEDCFSYLKKRLCEEYSFALVEDLLSLPCMQFETEKRLSLLLSILEDNQANDAVIRMLCQLLQSIPGKIWNDYRERIESIIETQWHSLDRCHLLLLAHTIEFMYAKGYKESFDLCALVYQRISLLNSEFNPDSDENIRIRLAKIAYNTHKYNLSEALSCFNGLKDHIKRSGRKHLMGMLNYYKGLSLRAGHYTLDHKNDVYFVLKARSKGFSLAEIYIQYRANNLETSK